MIKKITGVVVALAAIAVIVVAILHKGEYASLVFDEPASGAVYEAAEEEARIANEKTDAADSLTWKNRYPTELPAAEHSDSLTGGAPASMTDHPDSLKNGRSSPAAR